MLMVVKSRRLLPWAAALAAALGLLACGEPESEPRQLTGGAVGSSEETTSGSSQESGDDDDDDAANDDDDDVVADDGTGDDDDSTPTTDPSGLSGTFERCYVALSLTYDLYAHEIVQLSGSSINYEIEYLEGDQSCNGEERMSDVFVGSYVANDSGDMTITWDTASRTIYTAPFVAKSNEYSVCGVDDWTVDSQRDVSGTCSYYHDDNVVWHIGAPAAGKESNVSFQFEGDLLSADFFPGEQGTANREIRYEKTVE